MCPQQYYGIVKKIHGIRPIHADNRKVVPWQNRSSILVATKGSKPNRYFYPQLRLDDGDDEHGNHIYDKELQKNGNDAIDTSIILYEASPGTMLFADNELDAARLLQADNDNDNDNDNDDDDDHARVDEEHKYKAKSTKQSRTNSKSRARCTNRATSCFVTSKSAILFR